MIAAFGLVRPGREGEAFCSSNEINKIKTTSKLVVCSDPRGVSTC